MNIIKVLHISPSGILYGTERHILSIVKYADKQKFQHFVVTPNLGNFNELLKNLNIPFFIAGRKPGYKNNLSAVFEIKDVWPLYKIIKNGDFDIVHSHLNFYSCLITKLAGSKKVIHTRHGIFWSEEELKTIGFINRYIQMRKSKMADFTIALSETERNTLIKYFNYSPDKILTIYNGVSVKDVYDSLNPELNKNTIYNTSKYVVGTVGRFERQKGFDILLEIARNVVQRDKDILFVIIGSGSLESYYKEIVDKYNIRDNVLILGYQKNIFDFVNSFDLFVHTSRWEGVPFVILEAMALKKPIAAISHPNVTGISEVIINGESGLLAENNYIQTMTDFIFNLKNNRNLQEDLAARSFERVKNIYTEENMSDEMHKIYNKLVE